MKRVVFYEYGWMDLVNVSLHLIRKWRLQMSNVLRDAMMVLYRDSPEILYCLQHRI